MSFPDLQNTLYMGYVRIISKKLPQTANGGGESPTLLTLNMSTPVDWENRATYGKVGKYHYEISC